jgi:hypothetical protein
LAKFSKRIAKLVELTVENQKFQNSSNLLGKKSNKICPHKSSLLAEQKIKYGYTCSSGFLFCMIPAISKELLRRIWKVLYLISKFNEDATYSSIQPSCTVLFISFVICCPLSNIIVLGISHRKRCRLRQI